MFTGIIEEIGSIANIQRTGESFVLTIEAKKVLEDVHLGDSIAVNGVCLTVTSFSFKQFTVDVMPETVKATSLNAIKRGSKVNLERAMAAGGRFGGHFVSGHIDGTGVIKSKQTVKNAVYYEIEADPDLLRYIILKGSVAVDGTSLTVFAVTENSFTLSLIPHTLSETVLGIKGPGDIVNLECDMIGKYVGHFLTNLSNNHTKTKSQKGITASFLEDNGFK
ncbi:riboflavin synthase [Bacillus sp. SORGH_AS 510]|uniref:riboflavin synthase n=1 Tax=Bacillus sp. SORGH_AS_0510 TaxID=3041771 RepID=UPI0027828EDD|nr:riboflavin synthase [Bacillus sp. SORGH_AS_0510]MDQ1146381.1 riboflavin synthase [Bacillus sp. SORGH_AS_0510]